MQTGIQFVLSGVVQNKMEFDGRDGKTVRLAEVAWMGGSHNFQCEDQEQLDKFPNEGEMVEVRGHLLITKGKDTKFKIGSISAGVVPKSKASA